MRITLYAHASKESAWEAAEKAGLSEEAQRLFCYAGDEHAIEYEVDDQGNATAVSIDDRPIKPTIEEALGEGSQLLALAEHVRKMRTAQNNFFRKKGSIDEARRLEREVDRKVERLLNPGSLL
jgi:hypothetical protein